MFHREAKNTTSCRSTHGPAEPRAFFALASQARARRGRRLSQPLMNVQASYQGCYAIPSEGPATLLRRASQRKHQNQATADDAQPPQLPACCIAPCFWFMSGGRVRGVTTWSRDLPGTLQGRVDGLRKAHLSSGHNPGASFSLRGATDTALPTSMPTHCGPKCSSALRRIHGRNCQAHSL